MVSDVAVTDAMPSGPKILLLPRLPGLLPSDSYDAATAVASSGVPSVHVRPSRIVNTPLVGVTSHSDATPGRISPSRVRWTMVS